MNLEDLGDIYQTFDNTEKLDKILAQLCAGIVKGQRKNPEFYGMVAAAVLGPDGQRVYAINYMTPSGERVHAERAALDAYAEIYGRVPRDSIIITTLSPCSEAMIDRYGLSCAQLIRDYDISRVYCGYEDPTQDTTTAHDFGFQLECTYNEKIQTLCKYFADTFLEPEEISENFADGKGPGRPGDSQRHGIPKGATMAELEKASHSKGRKGQLARWQLNMRRGQKKTNEVINHPGIKTKNQDTSGLVNKGEPVPPGKEQKLLGTRVGKLGAYEVYKWDKGNDSAYSVFDPKTRISQMTVSGHNKPHNFEIFGVYGGPLAPIRAADLYAWLVKNQGLTLVSDKYQSPGGQRVWQELEQRYSRSVNVYAYNMRTNEPINTGADDPESTHGDRGDVAQNVRLVAAPK